MMNAQIEITKITDFFKAKYDLDITMFETSFLEKAIRTRMGMSGKQKTEDYLSYLKDDLTETAALTELLTNSYSEFFRNPITFAYLEKIILPAIIKNKQKNKEKEIRIWSAACAGGQEAYSLAMLCDEIMDRLQEKLTCLIFATDKNENELAKAQNGSFPVSTLNKVTLKHINSYFIQQDGYLRVIPKIREYIDFSVFDLLADKSVCPPASIYGNFDLIICSNILFYYTSSYRKHILGRIGNCLAEGGYLITGEVEREFVKDIYREVFPHSGIFKKDSPMVYKNELISR